MQNMQMGYADEGLQMCYEQLHSKGHFLVVAGDFNTQLRTRMRGDLLQELAD